MGHEEQSDYVYISVLTLSDLKLQEYASQLTSGHHGTADADLIRLHGHIYW